MSKKSVLKVPGNPVVNTGKGRAVRVSLPEWLIEAIDHRVKEEYGSRGRSRWVDEAVIQLIEYPSWTDMLSRQQPSADIQTRIKQFNLSQTGSDALDRAILEARREDPYLEGVISEIVRTAVSQRIFRSPGGLDLVEEIQARLSHQVQA